MIQKVISKCKLLVYFLFQSFPINKTTVFFFSYYGEQYSGSPKYLSEYLYEKNAFHVIWAFVDKKKHLCAKYNRSVKYGGIKYYYYLATAKYLVTNYRMTTDFHKRKNQVYIQTWHSSLRLKMIESDAADTLPRSYIDMAKNDSQQIDYLLAGSRKSKEIFENAFWYNGPILKTGTPQCDILIEKPKTIVTKVKKHFALPDNSRIMLYAPTFRKDHKTDIYSIDTDRLIKTCENKFGGSWYLLIRLHPHLINQCNFIDYSSKVLQATDYDDVQELLCAADLLISDYSAIIFDYAITKKPCFLYTPDIDEYTKNDRKLYFDINTLPFPCCMSYDSLIEHIFSFTDSIYESKVNQFLESVGSYDDGNARKRVYELFRK